MIQHKIKVINKSNMLSKIIDLDSYNVREAIKIFNFYSLHKSFRIEFV